ncbi:NUDIX hydrolase [Streptomyces chiangmaiensis]|uniref:NUDIX hydrolase n=1 Tax=Streptomyces chiangmaiensis TaxID=766497 RepID=A0ABU7FX89_9ACTN|nr:NUDIX hydrolase [Streptomyces chiangmaiensis]MED7828659.1 NUDIX hydrolase [Streptomyces chiangmaiensis]
MSAADEVPDIVDEHHRVVGQSPRAEAYTKGLHHHGVLIQAKDAQTHHFVHHPPAKPAFPAFRSKSVGEGEPYGGTALHEAEKELSASGLPRPEYLGTFLDEDGHGHSWWSAVHQVRCHLPSRPQTEGVACYDSLTKDKAKRQLRDREKVPDGLAAHERLKGYQALGCSSPATTDDTCWAGPLT